jgi:hypothetical protein
VKDITVIIPTSPIPSHPSTAITDETIASVRKQLPDSRIIVTADGVRAEQVEMANSYFEYLVALNKQAKVDIVLHTQYIHQAEMMKRVLPDIKTSLLLYLEHDTPLCDDLYIPWTKIADDVLSGEVNLMRFHHYDLGRIPDEHQYLMLPPRQRNVPFIPTIQWSQRAHVTTPAFYSRVLSHFSANSRTMIEDRIYGVIMGEVAAHGKEAAWESWRLAIYNPEGHIKRSRDLNGRDGGPKFDNTFIF